MGSVLAVALIIDNHEKFHGRRKHHPRYFHYVNGHKKIRLDKYHEV